MTTTNNKSPVNYLTTSQKTKRTNFYHLHTDDENREWHLYKFENKNILKLPKHWLPLTQDNILFFHFILRHAEQYFPSIEISHFINSKISRTPFYDLKWICKLPWIPGLLGLVIGPHHYRLSVHCAPLFFRDGFHESEAWIVFYEACGIINIELTATDGQRRT